MKKSQQSLMNRLLGHHNHELSRVFTIRRRTYQVCVSCGREFEYSWELMRRKKSFISDHGYRPEVGIEPTEAPVV
jgi:hypothetical protein